MSGPRRSIRRQDVFWWVDSFLRAAIAAGFDTHMTKPVDLRKLCAVVDDLMRRRQK